MSEERKLLADLVAAIPSENLPELQKRLGTFNREETHQQGKHMHRLVSEQTQLRKQLETLRTERATFASAWEVYVGQLLDLWLRPKSASPF